MNSENDEIDSEQEDELAYDMFIDDIKDLRVLIVNSMHKVLIGQISLEDKFSHEREFFTAEISQAQQTMEELN